MTYKRSFMRTISLLLLMCSSVIADASPLRRRTVSSGACATAASTTQTTTTMTTVRTTSATCASSAMQMNCTPSIPVPAPQAPVYVPPAKKQVPYYVPPKVGFPVPQSILQQISVQSSDTGSDYLDIPADAVEYTPAKYTQSIFRLDERRTIRPVLVSSLIGKWHQSGGMEGVSGYVSRKFKTIPPGEKVKTWQTMLPVKNSYGYYQYETGITRSYPDGTRFDDVLINSKGDVFEHRVRQKDKGVWTEGAVYVNVDARPVGYKGL